MGKCRSARQVKTPKDCFKCVCVHRHLCWRVCSYPTSLRHFQSLSARMKPPGFVCPSHIVSLLWHRSCSFSLFLAFASAVWVVCVCVHTLTHCLGWLTSLGSGHASLPRSLLWPPSTRKSHKPLSPTPLWIWFLFDNCLFSGQFFARLRAPRRQRLCALYFLLS